LQSSSAITRAGIIYEVGDITDTEAKDWLMKQYDMKEKDAAALVDHIAGGRFPLLTMCGISKKAVAVIREELDTKTEADLLRAGVSPKAKFFKALLSLKRIKQSKAHVLLPEAKISELLRLNILQAHPDQTYTFHDRHVLRFMERAAGT